MIHNLKEHVDTVQARATQGGRPMNAQQSIEGALILLEQMTEDPNEVLQVLDTAEQSTVMQELGALAERAESIQSGADLLKLADAIHRLIEDRPGLRALLLSEGTDVERERALRTVTIADQQAKADLNVYAQQRAPLIRNTVIECRAQLEAALQKTAKPKPGRHQGAKP